MLVMFDSVVHETFRNVAVIWNRMLMDFGKLQWDHSPGFEPGASGSTGTVLLVLLRFILFCTLIC